MEVVATARCQSGNLMMVKKKPLLTSYGESVSPKIYRVFWQRGTVRHPVNNFADLERLVKNRDVDFLSIEATSVLDLAWIFAVLMGHSRIVECPEIYHGHASAAVEAKMRGPRVEENELRFIVTKRSDIVGKTTFYEVAVNLSNLSKCITNMGQSIV